MAGSAQNVAWRNGMEILGSCIDRSGKIIQPGRRQHRQLDV